MYEHGGLVKFPRDTKVDRVAPRISPVSTMVPTYRVQREYSTNESNESPRYTVDIDVSNCPVY